jgi:hypothetical protein
MPRNADRLIMLLSTDWFLPYWTAVGLEVDLEARARLQQDCRAIVRAIVGGAPTYWLASFAEPRINETNRQFMAALQRQNLDQRTINLVTDIVTRLSGEDPESTSVWLLADLTRQLIAKKPKNPTGLSGITEDVLGDAWKVCAPKLPDFEQVSRESVSEWDRYIASLTPDLPTMLADYAASIVQRNQLRCYWHAVNKTLSPAEKSALIRWYNAEAAAITGKPVTIPRWMQ